MCTYNTDRRIPMCWLGSYAMLTACHTALVLYQANYREEWLACLRSTFEAMDVDKDGRLKPEDILEAIKAKLPEAEVSCEMGLLRAFSIASKEAAIHYDHEGSTLQAQHCGCKDTFCWSCPACMACGPFHKQACAHVQLDIAVNFLAGSSGILSRVANMLQAFTTWCIVDD
eukprot:GHRR01031594.1.p1 GENE.GHRR01031594.1~~GHRR01031594.1.p1  ORF type:complete len:171 (+),score=7.72 GHRR01031594.1:266-778(+)